MTIPPVDNKEALYDIFTGEKRTAMSECYPPLADRLANEGGGQGWPQMAGVAARRLQMFCSRGLYWSLLP
ncbi:hypothetical protein TNIN_277981 [Trichonephila inaurata madagascariensis]|uniref:Uncharacterized protein n=1 Tax=Trichonephila inaurata madagascariensis TaxID=2747483 RepID=A0A8X7C9C3_9ARAC|nr:hypothetical protein TNIN_277981 [Trichonephila inaurata madagascariensis]